MRKAGWQTPAELRALRLQAPGASGGGELPRPRSKPSAPRAARLHWQVSGRCAGRCRAAPLPSIRQMSGQRSRGSVGAYQAMSGQVSRGSAGEYQEDEQAGVARLSWRVSGR